MRIENDQLRLSATDLVNHLGCRLLTAKSYDRAKNPRAARDGRGDGGGSSLIAQFGDEHELRCLEQLKAAGLSVIEIETGFAEGDLERAAAATIDAMRRGVDVIFQATFIDAPWIGHADFLVRVATPSALGDWSYEPVDAKLARSAKVRALLQLGEYAAQIATVQETSPQRVHLWLGHDERYTIETAQLAAFHRRSRARLTGDLGLVDELLELYPDPCSFCSFCRWQAGCEARRRDDDHLTYVAGIRSSQIAVLREHGVETLAALAGMTAEERPDGINSLAFDRLRTQARLQLHHRNTGAHAFELLDPAHRPGLGYAALPAPSDHDLFWDLEGNPFAEEDGIEYLWGVTNRSDDFTAIWAHTLSEEKRALEAAVDLFVAQRTRHPESHIYHYAHHEEATLKRLAARYGTREAQVDQLLRTGALVDLYSVVRSAVQCSTESYSIKQMERFYRDEESRQGEVTSGFESIVQYEQWRVSQDPQLLDDIAAYNKDDCVSTRELADWLAHIKADAEREFGAIPWAIDPDDERSNEALEMEADVAALHQQLLARVPGGVLAVGPATSSESLGPTSSFEDLVPEVVSAGGALVGGDEVVYWLLAGLLDFHRRDAKADWWAYFARLEMDDEELFDDSEAIAGLIYEGEVGTVARSLLHRFRFDSDQPYKLKLGDKPLDPSIEALAGTVHALDPVEGTIELKKGRPPAGAAYEPPAALVPDGPRGDQILRDAVFAVCSDIAERGLDDSDYPAIVDLLRAAPPRLAGGATLSDFDGPAGDRVVEFGARLDRSYLAVQGPPGAGKTYNAARLVKRLVDTGHSIGVCGNSHRVIENLLEAVAKAGVNDIVKVGSDDPEIPGVAHRQSADAEAEVLDGRRGVTGGTAWFFSREALRQHFDVILIDEAGQFSLANTIAVGSAARSLVLVGDPQQLDQPMKGVHPAGVDRSALAHVLGGHATIRDTHGVFLDSTWRMHPDVCDYVSETSYSGRLQPAAHCGLREIEGIDHGLRWVPVPHEGNSSRSREEARAVAQIVDDLLGRTVTDEHGDRRKFRVEDVLIVAPYNAQVRELKAHLPDGMAVGTVDLFQGREAMVSILSLTASSAADASRGLGFVLDNRRFNVGVSRAQRLAVVVGSPRLADSVPGAVAQVPLISDLCRFIEMASPSILAGGPRR